DVADHLRMRNRIAGLIVGDATERVQSELDVSHARKNLPRLRFIPLHASRRRMTKALRFLGGLSCRCDPSGIRTRVTAVRGRRTRPLYDGAVRISRPVPAAR